MFFLSLTLLDFWVTGGSSFQFRFGAGDHPGQVLADDPILGNRSRKHRLSQEVAENSSLGDFQIDARTRPLSGESYRPLTLRLSNSFAVRPFLSPCFGEIMPPSWWEAIYASPTCITIQLPIFIAKLLRKYLREIPKGNN